MTLRGVAKSLLPSAVRRFLVARERAARQIVRRAREPVRDFSELRRLTPVSSDFGLDRGRPIDRYYIESFLTHHRADVRGRVLEVLSDTYTRRFDSGVLRSDVLHPVAGNPDATIVGDLATGAGIPEAAFDCIICTQTLHFIYGVHAAIANLRQALAPGGVLLATLPGISQISRYDADRWGDYWRFTSLAVKRLFGDAFDGELRVESYGNVLAAVSFLHGLAVEELIQEELDYCDPDYEVTICVRAARTRS